MLPPAQILSLFDIVADILNRLQSELSAITTSDTGSDPTKHIRDSITELRGTLEQLHAKELQEALQRGPYGRP